VVFAQKFTVEGGSSSQFLGDARWRPAFWISSAI
jgi:hypothetical protein